MVPAECIAHAGLKDEVIILGVDNHLEVWDKKAYLENLGDKDLITAEEYPDVEF